MIYSTEKIDSKNGEKIPLFKSGRPVHSKYNPQNERIQTKTDTGFIVVGGIGGGFHLKNLLAEHPDTFILAVEADEESLVFAKSFSCVREISGERNIALVSLDCLGKKITETYLPAFHGNISLSFLRSWENENHEIAEATAGILKESLKAVSADFSVQSHFGKQWQRNILLNLKHNGNLLGFGKNGISPEKIAAVIAAGATLDHSIQKLKDNRDGYFIISTDTAFGTLKAHGIVCDAAVSVDAQHVSSEHFFSDGNDGEFFKDTVFVFNTESNFDSVCNVKNLGGKSTLAKSSHPLAEFALSGTEAMKLDAGSGTVTIACCDLADNLGFRKIEVFGADFAYSEGKPYAKGTYLEKQFMSLSSRTETTEFLYTRLMYRTELKRKNGEGVFSGKMKDPFTSEVLESYEKSILQWTENRGWRINGRILEKNGNIPHGVIAGTANRIDFWKIIGDLTASLEKQEKKILNNQIYCILPFIAWQKNTDNEAWAFSEYLKLCLKSIKRFCHEK